MSYNIAIVAPYIELSKIAEQVCDELEVKAMIAVGDLGEGVEAAKELIEKAPKSLLAEEGLQRPYQDSWMSRWLRLS